MPDVLFGSCLYYKVILFTSCCINIEMDLTTTGGLDVTHYRKVGRRQQEVIRVIWEKAGRSTNIDIEKAVKGDISQLLQLSNLCRVISTDHSFAGPISHGLLSGHRDIKSVCTCGCKQLCHVFIIEVGDCSTAMLLGSECIVFLTPERLGHSSSNALSRGIKKGKQQQKQRGRTRKAATSAQINLLLRLGESTESISTLTLMDASQLINEKLKQTRRYT
jgi:hypothetical protein